MSQNRWQQMQDLFEAALALPPSQREPYLAGACKDDAELLRDVRTLLDADGHSSSVLNQVATEVVARRAEETRQLGHYRLGDLLGSGGMGKVYKAVDVRLDRQVALKLLLPHLNTALAKERFLGEAKALSRLDHPHICTLFEIGEENDQLFIVMAFYEGKTLEERLRAGPLSSAEAVDIAMQTARGLEAAHAKGILHRDIKPANVMLTVNGVKILDFGIAKLAEATTTRSGFIVGTLAYMAPERLRNEPADAATDLWSLGVVLYEMLTGEPAFRGSHTAALIHAVLHAEPLGLATLPGPLGNIVRKTLARERRARYRTATELLADLSRAQRVQPSATTAGTGAPTERRQVTVLHAAVDSASVDGQPLDPEVLLEILPLFREICEKVVARFEGYTVGVLGEAVTLCFGYPVAHEDDARRAVESGLAIIQAIEHWNDQFQTRQHIRLAVRVGIDTGVVIATERGGAVALVGQTPGVAASLRDVAAANSLVISANAYQLARHYFACEVLGDYPVSGFTAPLAAYRVRHESKARSRIDTGLVVTRMVGRQQELALLLEHWRQVLEGNGQSLLIYGEPGIGKSRLVRAVEEHITADPSAWLTLCQCSPYHRNSALFPIIDLLERVILRFTEQDSADRRLEKLEGFLIQYGLQDALPPFAALLSLPLPVEHLQMSPERQRQLTLDALSRILLERSTLQPMLLVVEDLHWADPSTLELLGLFIEQAPATRMFALFTCRPEFKPPWPTGPRLSQIVLRHLSGQQARDMVEQVTGTSQLSAETVSQIIARTDGVPLFVEELTKAVVEARLAHTELAIPTTLQASLTARLDRLGPAKTVAQLGAVLGREFSYDLLKTVADVDEAELKQDLDSLVNAGLLQRRGLLPKVNYSFKHALIQEAAYQSLLKSTRRDYHARVAELLETQVSGIAGNEHEKLAYHWMEAGNGEKAIAYWKQAGDQALRRAANVEAIAHFRQALAALKPLPDCAEKLKRELSLQAALGPALMAIKGYASPEVEQACSRAREICHQLGDDEPLFPVLWGLWAFYFVKGDLQSAMELARQVEALAATRADPRSHLMAHHAVGFTLYYQAAFEDALHLAEQGLSFHDLATERELSVQLQFSSTVALLGFGGSAQWMLGYPARAQDMTRRSIELARSLEHPPTLGFALSFATWFHAFTFDFDKTRVLAEEVLNLSIEQHFALWRPIALFFRGWATCKLGNPAAGLPDMREGHDGYLATGSTLIQPHMLALLAEILFETGAVTEALGLLEQGMAQARNGEDHTYEPELYRTKGAILSAQAASLPAPESINARAEAEACLREAMRIAQEQKARILGLRAAMSLAEHWAGQGQATAALALVEEYYVGFTEGFTAHDLIRAQALLNRLKSDSSS